MLIVSKDWGKEKTYMDGSSEKELHPACRNTIRKPLETIGKNNPYNQYQIDLTKSDGYANDPVNMSFGMRIDDHNSNS